MYEGTQHTHYIYMHKHTHTRTRHTRQSKLVPYWEGERCPVSVSNEGVGVPSPPPLLLLLPLLPLLLSTLARQTPTKAPYLPNYHRQHNNYDHAPNTHGNEHTHTSLSSPLLPSPPPPKPPPPLPPRPCCT